MTARELKQSRNRVIYTLVGLLVLVGIGGHAVGTGDVAQAVSEFRDSLHPLAFAVLTAVIFTLLSRATSPRAAFLITCALLVILAIFGETLQFLVKRQASITDLGRDLLGCLAGWLIVLSFRSALRPAIVWPSRLFAVAAAAAVLWPVAQNAQALVAWRAALPTILSFEEEWEQRFFRSSNGATLILGSAPKNWPEDSGQLVTILPRANGYSGIEIDPSPDWSRFRTIRLTAASGTDKPLEIGIRIDDRNHNGDYRDRFGRNITVGPESGDISIPLAEVQSGPERRKMNMSAIRRIVIYVNDPGADAILVIDEVRLDTQ